MHPDSSGACKMSRLAIVWGDLNNHITCIQRLCVLLWLQLSVSCKPADSMAPNKLPF